MKQVYPFFKPLFCFFLFFLTLGVSAQIVNIPDAAMKSKLLNHSPVIDTNGDGDIQVSEAQAFTGNLDLTSQHNAPSSQIINDATGINAFVNASGIRLMNNSLTSLDVSAITGLDSLKVRSNNLVSLDVAQNPQLIKIMAESNNLTSFTAVANTNLQELNLSGNPNLTTLNVGVFPNLKKLEVNYTGITTIDLTSLTNLEYLNISFTSLTYIDLSANTNLQNLLIHKTNIVSLDVSSNSNLQNISFFGNSQLTYINLKNGNNHNMELGEGFLNVPNLQAACVDEIPISFPHPYWYYDQINNMNLIMTTYCNFSPGQFNTITGNLKVDMGAGCADASAVNVPNVFVKTVDNSVNATTSATFTSNLGQYDLYVGQGTFTTTADLLLPTYFSISPTSHSSNFNVFGTTDQADFCISSTQSVNDLNVTIVPLFPARPGSNVHYVIVYENMGTVPMNGQIVFQFDNTKQSFVAAVPTETASTSNSVTFNFTNLQPLHQEEITINLLTAQPPTVNLGDVLNLTATITPITNDYTPNDNVFQLAQTVVGPFDPNDKQVLEGDEIAIADADEYLHYLIRFQNMGTASAINVVVADKLSDQLDWNSIKMLSASHDYRVEITDGKNVEFIFENINLPHEAANAPGSHGYVAFKIKPKANIAVGDIIEGKAAIFFDFNAPIITNTVSTEVVQNLSTEGFEEIGNILLYPNPTNGIVKISTKTEIGKIEVFSITGKRLLFQKNDLTEIDFQQFPRGIYFVKITGKNGRETTQKIVRK